MNKEEKKETLEKIKSWAEGNKEFLDYDFARGYYIKLDDLLDYLQSLNSLNK